MSGPSLFSWLHLSDIHVGHGDKRNGLDQQHVMKKLADDVIACIDEGFAPRPNAIFVTGDIAFCGAEQQYLAAGKWISELAKSIRVGTNKVYTVPGNHDVDRTVPRGNVTFRDAFERWRESGNIDNALNNPDARNHFENRFSNYLKFCSLFTGVTPTLFWSQRLICGRLRLKIVGLNSALLSNDDADEKHLALGLTQLETFTSDNRSDELTILLTHHPFAWLRDRIEVQTRTMNSAHIHLYGHIHTAQSLGLNRGGGDSWLSLAAGSVHSDPSEVIGHGYSFGTVRTEAEDGLSVEIWPRRWSIGQQGFRIDADNTPARSASAVHILERPKASKVLESVRRFTPVNESRQGPFVFDFDELYDVVEVIDEDRRRRREVVEEFERSVLKRVKLLFNVDEKEIALHPLFGDMQYTLDCLVPGIVLNERNGRLERAQTRHAILRTDTLHSLLIGIDQAKLRDIARGIGRGAAGALIENVLVKGNYIPATAHAFVALWDFWDRTGGWGRLVLHEETHEENTTWKLQVEQNFLEYERHTSQLKEHVTREERMQAADLDLKITHQLCEFWCGYIHGFLEESLPRILSLMLEATAIASERIFVPLFTEVLKIEHLIDGDSSQKTDIFQIEFAPNALSESLALLSGARESGEPYSKFYLSKQAIEKVSEPPFREILKELNSRLDITDPRSIRLHHILDGVQCLDYKSLGEPEEWLADANWVLHKLAGER